ncbi:uncharacterized protein LOC143577631 [Bidens hawaiensis]|uniref:uncharacterized protein LOC143577631 n=1 Tax=Bidens hawaiensis TaxID=980011 RepID=UPI004049B809
MAPSESSWKRADRRLTDFTAVELVLDCSVEEEHTCNPNNNYIMKWSKWVPAKCNIHAWRAEMDRIPTRGALERRNISVSDNVCALFTVRDHLELHKSIKLGDIENEVFHGVIIIACWRIWKARNDKVFEGKEVKVEDIIGDIKVLGFLWFNLFLIVAGLRVVEVAC